MKKNLLNIMALGRYIGLFGLLFWLVESAYFASDISFGFNLKPIDQAEKFQLIHPKWCPLKNEPIIVELKDNEV